MIKYIGVIFLFITLSAHADNFIQGEGKFWAEDEDSLGFVKKQLIHEGFKDAISKELVSMSLNKSLFWDKYQEKFDIAFAPVEESLKNKYQIDSENVSDKKIKLYKSKLRIKKLKMRVKFGNLHRVVQSYAVKKITRALRNPNSRYIKLETQINKNLLSKIYYSYIRGKKHSEYGSLYIQVDYKLDGCSYTDLGVEKEKDFTEVVNDHWLKWFSQNKPNNIANVEILREDKAKKLKEYFKLPYERMIQDIPEVFVNSLYLKIEVKIKKVSSNEGIKEYEFSYGGGAYLLDLQSNNVLASYKFTNEDRTYRNTDYNVLSTRIANHVYRMPFGDFSKLKKVIRDITPINSINRVSLFDFANMNKVNQFLKLVEARGIKHSLKARLESIGTNRAEVVFFFDGNIEELKTLLISLQSAKSDMPFEFIDTDNLFGIKFKQVIAKTEG